MDPGTCATCHPEHFAEWAGSMHAYASDDPVFLALDRLGQRLTGGALGGLCVGCHAPAAVAAGATVDGTNLESVPRYLRGVTCWACHAVDGVITLHNGGLQRANDGIMRGGIGDPVETPAHGSVRSKWLAGDRVASSDACGACHDVVLGNGVAVESTYREWAGSVFGAEGSAPVSCATCHMIGRDGPAAALPEMPQRRLHDHGFPGIDQALTEWPDRERQDAGIARDLRAALAAKLCVVPGPGGAAIEVTLDNVQVGHAFPSGVTHARRVWVEVNAYAVDDTLLTSSGRFAPGEVVSAARDPSLWLLSSRFLDGGVEVAHVWDAQDIASELLPPSVTNVPSDPRFNHARRRSWAVLGSPERVEIAVHVEAVGLDVLDDLIAAGELDPAVRDAMTRRTIPSLARTWRSAGGFGCVP